MAPESEEPSSPVRDGLTQAANPVPRENIAETASDDAGTGGTDGGGTDDAPHSGEGGEPGTTDSAGGIAPRPDRQAPGPDDPDSEGGGDGEPEEAPGLNIAAGPAEEADRESGGQELPTDISPSD
ncbi:hypothetical protein ACX80W_08840 [Arthrobacter sp. TMN-37]